MQNSELASDGLPSEPRLNKEAAFAELMLKSNGCSNNFYFARILSSWLTGDSVLPAYLGTSVNNYQNLFVYNFSRSEMLFTATVSKTIEQERIPEWDDLVNLLLEYRAGEDVSENWMAEIVASACMGMDHLWQDLGLWSRGELSSLLELNFPALARRNTRDMKWKKFLYKQLCERDETFVCRAPSCDVCADYDKCFGPEE
jgi:nitrogen fixation protein NifQ